METYVLILFGFDIVPTFALGLDASASKHDIQTLKARLDRRDALEAKKSAEPESSRISSPDAWAKDISVKELRARLRDRDEEIKNLNGDIAKLKFDYACQVAGPKRITADDVKKEYDRLWSDASVKPAENTEKPAPLRGEWVYDSEPELIKHNNNTCKCCAGSGENRLGDECATCCGTGQNNPVKQDENTDGRV